MIHKQNVAGSELWHVKKWVSLKKVGFQISGMSGLCVHLTLDQGTSHRSSLEYFSISEVHRIGQMCLESEGPCPRSPGTGRDGNRLRPSHSKFTHLRQAGKKDRVWIVN